NVILIMVDDMGFSDLGYQGGEIETPHLDALAHGGVRFSQFYNSGRCCPTRATLMTGLHPHETGIGWMTEPAGSTRGDKEPPAYQGHLNDACVTVAEVLGASGYATYMTGKWHLGYDEEEDWPLQRGFDRYYGCVSGATRFFTPVEPRGMFLDNEMVEPVSTTEEAFYTTDAFTDHAIRFIGEHFEGEKAEDPYFLYLAYTAPHWPLQAFEDDVAKYRGNYKGGWDKLREERYRRQIELGLINESWELSAKTPGIPEWDSLSEAKKDEMDLKMAVYAAMVDRVDQNIGKLVAELKENGTLKDTLILFLSDNGACQEGGMLGRGEFYDIGKRNSQDSNSYGEAWANAGSTPFRLYKHFAHEGGSATPFFMHWPAGIEAQEDWFEDPAQLIDVLPTLIDVAGAEYPDARGDVEVPQLDGISLRPAFEGEGLGREEPIFIEHERHAFVRDGKWKLVGREVSTIEGTDESQWELYDMEADRTETNNLAMSNSKKVDELAAQWEAWANRVSVYPRGVRSPAPPSSSPAPAETSELKQERFKPEIAKTGFGIRAEVEAKKPNGVVLAQGGNAFGYSLYFEKGVPAFAWRNRSKLTELRGDKAVRGKVTLEVRVSKSELVMKANGKKVASAAIDGFLAEQPGLGLFLGGDGVHAVGNYEVPNRFSGKVLDYRILSDLRKVPMRTSWGRDLDPESVWSQYPRPQFERDEWTNLNGYWNYAVTPGTRESAPKKWAGEILVPFAIEAPLSGVERRLLPEEALWYQRTFPIEKEEGQRYLLHFEAVDYACRVQVNGVEVGGNTGGNLPFAIDITDAAKSGENELVVRVIDGTDTGHQLHGKQVLSPGGIWYTPVSGIWQTVWMEAVPDTYLSDLKITTKTSGRVEVQLSIEGGGRADAAAMVRLGGTDIAGAKANGDRIQLSIPNPRLWSPDDPTLYDLEITVGEDTVKSYFGIRETGIERDAEGHLRFTLNGKPIFHWGTLDQGWWPDGLLTPPSEEAMVYDIQYLKDAGFNTIRKHIKVEPRRYYHACDRIGMLVWQDQVSSGTGRKRGEGETSPDWTRLEVGGSDAVWPDEAHEQYLVELKTMIDTFYNHPSIVQWVPFNEAWGQHRTIKVGEWVVPYDPTRSINIASGGNFFEIGHIVDDHAYPHPEFAWEDDEGGRFSDFVKVMGEFGGHGFPVEGHLWSNETRNWGYGGIPKDKEEWLERYRTSIEMLVDLKKKGIAGGIYTQTTDVEGEINGLITYDREVQKLKPDELRDLSRLLFK
ncbi:MAG: sulfatase-like hydrolase/transferase, partial [Verrucomicrobiales bacterium]|nr:sulfatase-like hydrolase/transferase [Verrucomicrobiales bacterium]